MLASQERKKKKVFVIPCHFFCQGLLVVSHLGSGLLWWHRRQYDRHSLVLHNTGSFDTNIPQNSSVVSRALISLLPCLVPGDKRFNLSLNKWWRLAWCSRSNHVLRLSSFVLNDRPISEYFLVRDTSLIPNILWFEYTVTRSEAR